MWEIRLISIFNGQLRPYIIGTGGTRFVFTIYVEMMVQIKLL